jgi:hypothetical protein
MRKSVHLSIPAEIYDTIAVTLVKNGLYRTVPEFILECTRNRIYELREQKMQRQNIRLMEQQEKQKREVIKARVGPDVNTGQGSHAEGHN